MLICEDCGEGHHLRCVGRKNVPKGEWRCHACTEYRRVLIVVNLLSVLTASINNAALTPSLMAWSALPPCASAYACSGWHS